MDGMVVMGTMTSGCPPSTVPRKPGGATPITVYSIVRGPWEARLSRVDGLAAEVDPALVRLRIGGWAVAGSAETALEPTAVTLTGSGVCSLLEALSGPTATAGFTEYEDASPLGQGVRVPWLEYPVEVGALVCALVELRGGAEPAPAEPATVVIEEDGAGRWNVRVLWPDGVNTSTQIHEAQINEIGVAAAAAP